MKTVSQRSLRFVVASLVFTLAGAIYVYGSHLFAQTKQMQSKPVAVVELFTSEGCSSCPSADQNLKRIAAVSKKNLQIVTLSFHVDYWNNLGWKDPFSQAAFTQRQREYAKFSNSHRIYTPQMIVNGRVEFVGSDRALSDRGIQQELSVPVSHLVALATGAVSRENSLNIKYDIRSSNPSNDDDTKYVLNVAITEDSDEISVAQGENAGRKLSHASVVKSFKVVPLTAPVGELDIELPRQSNPSRRIVAYVQAVDTLAITGAAALP